jgi:hypothetical protein
MGSGVDVRRRQAGKIEGSEARSTTRHSILETGFRARPFLLYLLFPPIQLASPASRTALEHVAVMQQAVEHGAGALVAPHDD